MSNSLQKTDENSSDFFQITSFLLRRKNYGEKVFHKGFQRKRL